MCDVFVTGGAVRAGVDCIHIGSKSSMTKRHEISTISWDSSVGDSFAVGRYFGQSGMDELFILSRRCILVTIYREFGGD